MKYSNNEEEAATKERNAGYTSGITLQDVDDLVRDPVIIRVVTLIDITNPSVLELLEDGLSINDIRYALTKSVISFIWSPPYTTTTSGLYKPLEITERADIVTSDEAYHNSLRGKLVLTKLGLSLLEYIKGM
jgi:hypothetical protein